MPMIAASTLPVGVLLEPLLWIFGVAAILVGIFHVKKLPSLLGFLVTGVLIGPAGFGVVENAEAISILAEVGIVLLMFTIGLEVSLGDLLRMRRLVIGGGLAQIASTALLFTGLASLAGLEPLSAIAVGLLLSASSTALVLRMLGDRGELGLPHGELSLSILLAQDFAVVGLMLVLPMLATGGFSVGNVVLGLGEGGLLAILIVIVARVLFPWVLKLVVSLRSRELFMLATFSTIFGTALLAEQLGLSLALGAFLAGIVVSESDYSHQMFAEVLPFRDIFNGLFFASVGLLIDPVAVTANWELLVGLVVAIVVGKAAIVFVIAKALRLTMTSSLLGAVALAQLGEFGLVLAQQAAGLELIDAKTHSVVIAAAVITMGITAVALPITSKRMKRTARVHEVPEGSVEMSDHVIVVGYGVNGHNVSQVLRGLGVPFVVVEMNQATVATESKAGLNIVLGDATRPALLEHLNVAKARALVSAIGEVASTREIVSLARHANPDLLIIARTPYVSEIQPLMELGADTVVPEEFETSIELVSRVMKAYGASEAVVQNERRKLREERYQVMSDADFVGDHLSLYDLLDTNKLDSVLVDASSPFCNHTLAELDFRTRLGATIVTIHRGTTVYSAPQADFRIEPGDRLVFIGGKDALRNVSAAAGEHDPNDSQ